MTYPPVRLRSPSFAGVDEEEVDGSFEFRDVDVGIALDDRDEAIDTRILEVKGGDAAAGRDRARRW
jgi:hypothetical protein